MAGKDARPGRKGEEPRDARPESSPASAGTVRPAKARPEQGIPGQQYAFIRVIQADGSGTVPRRMENRPAVRAGGGHRFTIREESRRGRQFIRPAVQDIRGTEFCEEIGMPPPGAGPEKRGIPGMYGYRYARPGARKLGKRGEMVKMAMSEQNEGGGGAGELDMCYNGVGVPPRIYDDKAPRIERNKPGIDRKRSGYQMFYGHGEQEYIPKGESVISRIVVICLVAIVSYLVVPRVGLAIERFRWKRLVFRCSARPSRPAVCTGFSGGRILASSLKPAQPGGAAAGSEERSLDPRKTVFLILRDTGACDRISWSSVFLIQTGTTVILIDADRTFRRDICVFHEEKSRKELENRLRTLVVPADIRNPLKPYGVAAGAFLEFLLFLRFISLPDGGATSIAALVAIFGKALPYCPPGLFCTLAALRLRASRYPSTAPGSGARSDTEQPEPAYGNRPDAKKNRRRKLAGFLLVSAGVLLNIAVLFFVIRHLAFD